MCGSSKSKSHPTIADKQCTTGESIVYKIRALRRACFNKKHSKFFNVMENKPTSNLWLIPVAPAQPHIVNFQNRQLSASRLQARD